jgi:hypothetical protein
VSCAVKRALSAISAASSADFDEMDDVDTVPFGSLNHPIAAPRPQSMTAHANTVAMRDCRIRIDPA